MSAFDKEIRETARRIEKRFEDMEGRLDDQLAKQELSYLRAALDAAERDDLPTALNFRLQAKLVRELRKRA